jgi:hypothetical protein
MTSTDHTSELIDADRVLLKQAQAPARHALKTGRSPHPYSYAYHQPTLPPTTVTLNVSPSCRIPRFSSGMVTLDFFLM